MNFDFENALTNLKDNKILTRTEWQGKKWVELKNGKFIITTQKIPFENSSEQWNPTQDDMLAIDWILIDPDDIKQVYYLSVNQLKNLELSQNTLAELKNLGQINIDELKPKPLHRLLDDNEAIKLEFDKDKLQEILSQNNIMEKYRPNINMPEPIILKK
jgi:hypothetical protein